ncbi:hypothetical protein Taro_038822, partial [Colocasia esculenta]|nr:hypothetical protein [Colocasia esculenta]
TKTNGRRRFLVLVSFSVAKIGTVWPLGLLLVRMAEFKIWAPVDSSVSSVFAFGGAEPNQSVLVASRLKMGGVFGKEDSGDHSSPESKLDAKMVEAMQRRAQAGCNMRSFDSLILKFPKIDESLRKCRSIFEQFDEDSNGSIDPEELKHCFQNLEISFTEEEITDLFEACGISENIGMKFNEFIVLLCVVYLLQEPAALHAKSRMGLPNLELTFETLVDAFVFLDKNKDGYVSKNEMVDAINETSTGERSSGRIAMKRFEEMDWDKNGMVTFKEFLFAFTRWIGIDDMDDEVE